MKLWRISPAGQQNPNLQSWFVLIIKCVCFLLINLASASSVNPAVCEILCLLVRNVKLKIQSFSSGKKKKNGCIQAGGTVGYEKMNLL